MNVTTIIMENEGLINVLRRLAAQSQASLRRNLLRGFYLDNSGNLKYLTEHASHEAVHHN